MCKDTVSSFANLPLEGRLKGDWEEGSEVTRKHHASLTFQFSLLFYTDVEKRFVSSFVQGLCELFYPLFLDSLKRSGLSGLHG